MDPIRRDRFREKQLIRSMNRKLTRQQKIRKITNGIRYWFHGLLPSEHIILNTEISGRRIPYCPRCGEIVYYRDRCVMCGQRFLEGAITVGEVIDNGPR